MLISMMVPSLNVLIHLLLGEERQPIRHFRELLFEEGGAFRNLLPAFLGKPIVRKRSPFVPSLISTPVKVRAQQP